MHHAAEPFRHWIIDDWFQPCSVDEVPVADWRGWEVSYDNDVERGKKTSRAWDWMPARLRTAFLRMRHPDTVDAWSKLTGIPSLIDDPIAHGAGLHYSGAGAFLQAHLDYELHPELEGKERRLNLILFMHPIWRPGWGGQLLLCDAWGKAKVEIDPVPGRLAVFECGPASYHAVRVIHPSVTVPRLSCAVYYLADARPTATRRRALFMSNRSKDGVPDEVK